MLVSLVQNNPAFGRKMDNARNLVRLMEQAAATETGRPELYVLPELCFSGYQFLSRDEAYALAEPRQGGEGISVLAEAAKKLDAAIVFGFPERSGGKLYNSSMLLTPEGSRAVYRKTHLFAKEKTIFDPGDSGFFVKEFRGLKIGLAVCFDWFFPEAFGTLARLGADLIAHSANLVMPYCQQAVYARAVENRVYVLTANRCGSEDRGAELLTYTGKSVAVSPKGEYLVSLPESEEAAVCLAVDPALARDKALNPYNDIIADRRPELYR